MDPTTLRLSEELRDTLDAEAEDAGFGSRSDYIRYLLANRDAIHREQSSGPDPTTTDTQSEAIDEHLTPIRDRLATLEHQVESLEQEVDELRRGQREQSEGSSSDTGDGGSTAAGTESAPPSAESRESADSVNTESGGKFRALEVWLEDEFPESEAPRDVFLDAARLLDSQGDLSASELREQLYERHPDAYSSAKVLWSATIHRHYEDIPGFEKPAYGTYRFDPDTLAK